MIDKLVFGVVFFVFLLLGGGGGLLMCMRTYMCAPMSVCVFERMYARDLFDHGLKRVRNLFFCHQAGAG